MKVICCGCGVHLEDKPASNLSENEISHGLCDGCAFEFRAQVGMSLPEYLNSIEAPVITVTPDGVIGGANPRACEILGKEPEKIRGYKGGIVFECENARLPEGCGETIHCSGCTIRRTVMETVETGVTNTRVPAYLNRYINGGSKRCDLLISTKKEGGVVFLTVEEMKEEVAVC